MKPIIALLAPSLLSSSIFAAIVRVPEDQPTIQAGIDAALTNDTVLVAPGEYIENVEIDGRQLILASHYVLSGDSDDVESTIIDGGGSGSAVAIRNVADSAVWLIGFTIRNSISGVNCTESFPVIRSNSLVGNDHGVYCYQASPTIYDNVIAGNSGYYGGGIKAVVGSSPTVIGNLIRDNQAYRGGGVYVRHSSALLEDNQIVNNRAEYGGGISLDTADAEIIGNTIDSNIATTGGGIELKASTARIDANLIRYNSFSPSLGGNAGGGISLIHGSAASITQNDISGNYGASASGAGINVYLSYASIYGNDITHNCGEKGGGVYASGSSEIDVANNLIEHNNADSSWGGGVMVSNNTDATIDHNTIHNNSANMGGGIYCVGTEPKIRYNDLRQNTALSSGGGIRMYHTDQAEIVGNTLVGNRAVNGGGLNIRALTNSNVDSNSVSENEAGSAGGGMYLFESEFLDVRWNTILSNEAGTGGGVVCNDFRNSYLNYNQIDSNRASQDGGGVVIVVNSNTRVTGNTLRGNHADGRGGGILTEFTDPIVDTNLIEGNEAGTGGGLYFDGGSPALVKSCVIGNRAEAGAGLYLATGSSARLGEVTFAGNVAEVDGGAILCEYADPVIARSILWADSAESGSEIYVWGETGPTLLYCDIAGGWDGLANFDADPRFCNAEKGNVYLSSTSPCLDVGPLHYEIGAFGVGCIQPTCCDWRVGDANGLGGDEPTIGDVSVLIDAKFITGTCDGLLECMAEADINQSGGLEPVCDDISIGDISTLIDYLFISQAADLLADCL